MGGAGDVVMRVEGASKKFCRSLTRSMTYGVLDIARDTFSLSTHPDRLRPEEFWAVDDITFELHEGESLGLVGPNGAGKSTLFKMLSSIIRPDRGRIRHRGRLGALIEVGAGFHVQLTGRENIFVNGAILGMSRAEVSRKLDDIIAFADIGDFLDTPVKFYSSGMLVRLGMAVAVHTEPQILLIDEVLAVGDINFQAKCFNRVGEMRRSGISIIFVSHNLTQTRTFTDNVLVMDHGRHVAYGPTSTALSIYVDMMKQKKEIAAAGLDRKPAGSGEVRFSSVRFCDESGRPISRSRSTEPVTVKIGFDSIIDVAGVVLELSVYGGQSDQFLRANNVDFGQPLALSRGSGELIIRLQCLPSNGGTLVMNAALWNRDRTQLFDWLQGNEIEIDGNGLSPGAVWVACDFSCEQDQAAERPSEPTAGNVRR